MTALQRTVLNGGRHIRWGYFAATLLAAFAAWRLYEPLTVRPFDMIDFSEFLPILRAGDSAINVTTRLVSYYASQGRANVLSYVAIALKWAAFGEWVPGWQLTRFGSMLAIAFLAWNLLRRLGATRLGALAGSSLFVISTPAALGFTRLTMGEPLGTLLLLVASLYALRYQASERWGRDAAALALLAGATVLCKEMFVFLVPVVVALATCWRADESFGWPKPSRRNVVLLCVVSLAVAIAAIPVLLAARNLSSGRFVAQYGGNEGLGSTFALSLVTAFLPFLPGGGAIDRWALLWQCGFVGFLIVGNYVALRTRSEGGRSRAVVPAALLLPLPLAAAYSPWPAYQIFYAIPLLIFPAYLVATAVSAVERHGRLARAMALAACSLAFVYGARGAHSHARRVEATQFVVSETVDVLHAQLAIDSLIVLVNYVQPQKWQGLGETLARYATATLRPIPAVREMSCSDAADGALSGNKFPVLRFSSHCPDLALPGFKVERHYRSLELVPPRVKELTVSATISPATTPLASPQLAK